MSADFLNFGASNFPFQKTPCKSASKSSFFALASRSGFGAAISDAVARSSFVFCNSVSADRIVVAASRLLGAAAACVILLSLQLDLVNRIGWLHQGCDSDLSADFLNFGASNFPLKVLLKSASKSFFFALASRSGFGAAIPTLL